MKDISLISSSSSITISNIHQNQLSILSNNINKTATTKWTTKEKLYLIALVMVNGDSDWSYICDEMNKWIKSTSSNENESHISISRTPIECSKQYRFMIKSFVLKNSYCDLKKIYNDLANQRLNELKNLIIKNREQYNDLHKEIEQILSMNISNFDQLAQIWQNLKTNFNNNQSKVTNDDEQEMDERDLEKNVQILLYINEKKRKEEEEREKERERLRLLQQQKEEEERKRKEEEERKELERQRLLREQQEKEEERKRQEQLILEQEKQKKLEEEEKIKKEKEEAAAQLNIKTESNDVIILSDAEMKEGEDSIKKVKSDYEYVSLSETHKKVQKDNTSGASVEWKPSIPDANSEENSSLSKNNNQSETISEQTTTGRATRRQQSLRLNPANKQAAMLTNRNRLNMSESNASSPSASSSSDHDLKNDETTTNSNSEQTNSSSSSSSKLTTRSTSKLAAAAAATSNTNKNKSNKPETVQQNNDDAELIFTPLIKCDKDDDQQSTTNEQNISSNEQEDTKNVSKSRKSISNNQFNKNKNNKSVLKQEEETSTILEQQTDQQEDQTGENSNLNNRSLRSKLRSNQQSQSQLQTNIISKRKSTVSAANSPAPLQTKDQGLVSIKNEPVQIATSSTVSGEENASNNNSNEENTTTVPTTRSKSTHQQTSSNQETNNAGSNKFEDEKAYRAWKKSIMMVLNNISCHKHATVFMQPVKDEIAPGYSSIVHRPMDLTTVKKNIENGSIKSTSEFQRDIMLMFTNAFMYNSSNHDIHKITLEMYKEVLTDIEQLLNAQEAMGDETTKPLRFKDIRSSTASDRGAEIEGREDANEIVVNLLMKSKKEAHNIIKDDLIETSSIKSSSSISTPLTSNSNSNSVTNKSINNKLDKSMNQSASNNNSTRKRRPSVSVSSLNESTNNQNNTSINSNQSSNTSPSQNNNQSTTPSQPKSKRRKSGR